MHVRLAGTAQNRASADPVIAAHALAAELAGERVLLSLMRLSLLGHKFSFDQPRLPAGNPDAVKSLDLEPCREPKPFPIGSKDKPSPGSWPSSEAPGLPARAMPLAGLRQRKDTRSAPPAI
jgi:hypothetical protein